MSGGAWLVIRITIREKNAVIRIISSLFQPGPTPTLLGVARRVPVLDATFLKMRRFYLLHFITHLAVLLAVQLATHSDLFSSDVHDEIGVSQVTCNILVMTIQWVLRLILNLTLWKKRHLSDWVLLMRP